MSDDRRHPTAMKNAAQKYDPIAPIERSHDGRRPHQRQQQRLAFALGSSIIVVLFILVLSLRPHEPAEVGNDHICSLLANVPANATWMGCSLSSCANELMAGARRMQSAVNSSLLMAAADTAATHVNLSHVCSAVEWTLRNVGVNGALVVVDDELEDSVLLGMRAVGGLYHLIGELMMRRRASGGCGRVSWTLRRLAQDAGQGLRAAPCGGVASCAQPYAQRHLRRHRYGYLLEGKGAKGGVGVVADGTAHLLALG